MKNIINKNSKKIDGKQVVVVVVIEKIKPKIFERILSYIYTGDCDLLHPGICPIRYGFKYIWKRCCQVSIIIIIIIVLFLKH